MQKKLTTLGFDPCTSRSLTRSTPNSAISPLFLLCWSRFFISNMLYSRVKKWDSTENQNKSLEKSLQNSRNVLQEMRKNGQAKICMKESSTFALIATIFVWELLIKTGRHLWLCWSACDPRNVYNTCPITKLKISFCLYVPPYTLADLPSNSVTCKRFQCLWNFDVLNPTADSKFFSNHWWSPIFISIDHILGFYVSLFSFSVHATLNCVIWRFFCT